MNDRRLRALQDAKQRKMPWVEVAQLVRGGLAGLSPGERSAFVAAAAEASGYSPKLLKRYVSALNFAKRVIAEGRASEREIHSAHFVTLELLSRLWARKFEQANEVLKPALQGRIRVLQLQEMLRAQSGSAQSKTGARHYQRISERSMLDTIEERFLPKCERYHGARFIRLERPLGFFMTADAVVVAEQNGRIAWADAFEVKTSPPIGSGRSVEIAIAQVALASTFFRHYWLVLGGTNRAAINRIANAIDSLNLKTCGIAVVNPIERDFDVVIAPCEDCPAPDRTREFLALLRQRLLS